jgi:hypothetical protein
MHPLETQPEGRFKIGVERAKPGKKFGRNREGKEDAEILDLVIAQTRASHLNLLNADP